MKYERNQFNEIMRRVWRVVVAVFAVVGALAVALAVVLGSLIGSASGLPSGGGNAYAGPGHAYIAKISVVGEISGVSNPYTASDAAYHHDWTIQTIDALTNDDDNKALYLYLNTPGGTVYESDDVYLKLMEYKEKTGRPVYAYMGSMAASGGYYIAAAADYVYANRNTWTGSIGVTIGTMFDVSGFLEEHGIKTETITSGRNKAMGGYFDTMTPEQKKIFQGLVDDAYDQFVGVVADGRDLNEKEVRALADGRIYTASQALSNGLIDEILGQKEAEDDMIEKVGENAKIDDAYYAPATNIFSSLGIRSGFGGLTFADLAGLFFAERSGESGAENGSGQSGDVSAVLALADRQAEAGVPEPMYLYGG